MASNISRKSNLKYSINGAFTQGTVSDEIADFLLAIKKKSSWRFTCKQILTPILVLSLSNAST